ncbi:MULTISPECIES: arginine--tRNA ligase [unclassified Neochlamydia]|uniref:arginine--tRNA ligase n=1 Tax=unclassified Neochlamydia TaxID=2643326 RepID=UPI001BD8834F|nr:MULTISPECIES: arginine--tRNA ligase [unclassified Neochlamydia]MBS4167269.1 Arginine--tRNA ligase [Neochlamydia sp. AcF65]MBS4169683.1 Arginine--tRNA ligase [Neochlamydia sp. AcF95]
MSKQMLLDSLNEEFKKATISAFPHLANTPDFPLEITQSTQDRFGHYQFNSAMKLCKILQKSPHEVAQAIVQSLALLPKEKIPVIQHVEIAGPGFINIFIHPLYLSESIQEILEDPMLGVPLPVQQRIVIDFSSPNTAKEMHVGHLRSTIIGDCIARVLEFLGHEVIRLNHIGDWGTAFGMLIAYIKETAPHVLQGNNPTDLSQLVSWYKASKQKFDSDLEFKQRAQKEVVALQSGDALSRKAWEMICFISEKAYQEIYDLLEVKIQTRGESFYNPLLPQIVKELEDQGLVEISQGAKCIFLEEFRNREGNAMPLMIQKSDGGYNYDTTDMAAIKQRIFEEKADRIIIVTDAGQSLHFQMIFKVAEKAGFLKKRKVQLDHVPFGLVLGNDGKKFRTRSGDTEKLIDLLQAGIKYAKEILIKRDPTLETQEADHMARILGIGAIKYADLACHRTSDYTFSYERMLKFEGNTAAYLMYSYVRIASIKRKVKFELELIKNVTTILLEHPSEIALALHLKRFGETLHAVSRDLLPHRLTDYLYTLAERFNAFFRDCRVEGAPEQNSRLLLCETTARILKKGLNLLGVQTVEKM